MNIRRRDALLAGAAALAATALPGSPAAAGEADALGALLASDRRAIRVLRVSSAPGGAAAVETVTVAGTALGNTGLVQFLEHRAARLAVYAAPPGHVADAGPSTDLLLITRGGAAVRAGRDPAPAPAGTLVLLEAPAAVVAGPDGYTAIKIRLS
jgi:hypothetical protein